MTITSTAAIVRDDSPVLNSPFMFTLGDTFKSYVEQQRWTNADTLYSSENTVTPTVPANVEAILNDIGDERKSMTPMWMSKIKVRDTSLGGNPVINPLPQYNETDDPPSPFTASGIAGCYGMGATYSQCIDDQQQILWIQAGRPLFNKLAAFYTGAIDPDMAVINDKGIMYSSAYKLGRLITTPLSIVSTIVTLPIEWLYRWSTYKEAPITSYYDFQSEQPLYYRYVNTILNMLTVNLGYMESRTGTGDDSGTTGASDDKAQLDQDAKLDKAMGDYSPPEGSPEYITKLQMDISLILRRRMKYIYGASQVSDKTNDTLMHEFMQSADAKGEYETAPDASTTTPTNVGQSAAAANNGTAGTPTGIGIVDAIDQAIAAMTRYKSNFMDGIKAGSDLGTYYAMQYIGFRLESSYSVQESFHNTPKRPEVDQVVNGKVASIREKAFSVMGSITSAVPIIGGALSGMVDAVNGSLQGLLSNTGLGGLAQLEAGSAMVSIPKVWDNSEFSNSYSFRVKLTAPAGDSLSILQSEYVPLACLLALSAPRGQGNASYTSPFLVKAFAKGMVSIPMGMITNFTINRGGSQHGWTQHWLPKEIDISFDIEDLTPTMFVSMGSCGWKQTLRDLALGTNNKFTSYIEMLAGIDLRAKVGWEAQKRRAAYAWRSIMRYKYPGLMDGMRVGSLPPSRIIAAITPSSWHAPSINVRDSSLL